MSCIIQESSSVESDVGASLRTLHQEVIIRPAYPALTNKNPFPGSDAHTISGAG